jgi:hypothetical protein
VTFYGVAQSITSSTNGKDVYITNKPSADDNKDFDKTETSSSPDGEMLQQLHAINTREYQTNAAGALLQS